MLEYCLVIQWEVSSCQQVPSHGYGIEEQCIKEILWTSATEDVTQDHNRSWILQRLPSKGHDSSSLKFHNSVLCQINGTWRSSRENACSWKKLHFQTIKWWRPGGILINIYTKVYTLHHHYSSIYTYICIQEEQNQLRLCFKNLLTMEIIRDFLFHHHKLDYHKYHGWQAHGYLLNSVNE